MLTNINPKLPMRDKTVTKEFYLNKLGFQNFGSTEFDGYLMVEKDNIQIHFFEFKELDPKENYGQVYIRTDDIDNLYQSLLDNKVNIHPNGTLHTKPWGQKEFALLDPDNNLLTFGQAKTKKFYIMTENKKRSVGNGIGIGAALGVAFGAAYGYQSGDLSKSIALGLAIGVALGAIFDFTIRKKKS